MEKMIIIGEPDKLTPEVRLEIAATFRNYEVEFKSPKDVSLSDMMPSVKLVEPKIMPLPFVPPLTRRERRANRRNNKL